MRESRMRNQDSHYSWTCALELERQRGALGAFVFASSRVDELERSSDAGSLALWREIFRRVSDLHSIESRVLH